MEALEPALISVLTRIGDGSIGAAGAQLWESLRSLIRRRGANPEAAGQLPSATPQGTAVGELVPAIVRAAEADPELAAELRQWLAKANATITSTNVANTINGTVSGTVIQIGNLGGDRGD